MDKLLRCPCGVTMGKIEAGRVVIYGRHHGEQHAAAFDLAELQRLAEEERQERENPRPSAA